MGIKKSTTTLNDIIDQKKIKEYTTYLIPIGFLLIVDNLWRSEQNILAAEFGTLFFFLYFYLIDYFVKEHVKTRGYMWSNIMLMIFIFLVIFFPFYFVYGSTYYKSNGFIDYADFSNDLNNLFLGIIYFAIGLLELKKADPKLSTIAIKIAAIIIATSGFTYAIRTFDYGWTVQQNLQVYGLMSLSFIGISVIYFIIELVTRFICKSIHSP